MKELLEEFYKDYFPKPYEELINEARYLIEDINYLKEHSKRNKINKYFDFLIIPTIDRSLNGFFISKLFYENRFYLEEDTVINMLKIFYITRELIELANKDNNNDFIIKKLIKWKEVVKYYTNLDLMNHISDFVGCSLGIGSLCKKISLIENQIKI